ncbi:MAG: DEAD/DEAH box helicase family protein [Silvanigrellaceae bacterium]|nr:DEAD/DEAH box helicase family protein [Silvanigrellaceae bacterium]
MKTISNLIIEIIPSKMSSEQMFQSDFDKYKELAYQSFVKANRRRPTDCLEGINMEKDYVPRSELISRIGDKCIDGGSILIRSPPCSGKTSLSQLLFLHFYQVHNYLPVSLSCLNWPEEKSFEDSFGEKSGLGNSLNHVLESVSDSNVIVVIIDEAQLLYQRIHSRVWEKVKAGDPFNVKWIFLSAYGEKVGNSDLATPFEFSKERMFGLNDMLFTYVEFSQYVLQDNWEVNESEILKKIYYSTGGHIGLLKKIQILLYNYKVSHQQKGE